MPATASADAPTVDETPADVAVPLVSDSQSYRRAFRDLRDGFDQRELWLSLGWQDIKQRYRRSTLGPFWITISTGLQAAAMGGLYSMILHQDLMTYLPYVTVGLIIWNVISAAMLEGGDVFIANEGLIKQLPSALSVHVYRLVWRQFLFFLHNLAIYVVMVPLLEVWKHLRWTMVLAVPGIALVFLNALWVSILFGIISTRYRDIAPLLGSFVMMVFVLTPVMWTTKALQTNGTMNGRARLVEINPAYHFLEIVRAPLLGDPIHPLSWLVVVAITVVGWAFAILTMKKYRSRVPYWV